jgi:hypothetical protein
MFEKDPCNASILAWLASIGAAGADQVAAACGLSAASARARLRVLERDGLARRERLLHDAPALHLLTRAGLRAAGRPEIDPPAISAAGFAHQLAVAQAAVALGREHGAIAITGERELRALERAEGRPLASAQIGHAADGSAALHRPDLVCWLDPLPVAVEVELTVKAPRRLRAIVRGWARSRLVGGVVYYAPPHVARAVAAALRSEQAAERVALLALEDVGALPTFAPRCEPDLDARGRRRPAEVRAALRTGSRSTSSIPSAP